MTVSLIKGSNVSLTKEAGGSLSEILVGLGWDAPTTAGKTYDLDASAIVVGADDQVLGDAWFVFYGNKTSPDGNVVHHGDNLTGAGDGDDEQITITLANLPATAEKIIFPVSIYQATEKGQNFGQVRNGFVRVIDKATDAELARYDLTEDAAMETCMLFGEVYRHNGEWKFRALGSGYHDGLAGIARDHGVHVG